MPVSLRRLRTATDEFFRLHWCLSDPAPSWCKRPFMGIGISCESADLPGCYALTRSHHIVYIGSAISRGKPQYVGYGLHSRLLSYMRRDRSTQRKDGQHTWEFTRGHSGIYTIGFPRERSYLAIALEHFLVSRFQDELENKIKVLRAPLMKATPKA